MVAVHVAQLLKEHTGATRAYEFDEPSDTLAPDVALASSLRGQARLLRTPRGILTTCDYQTEVIVECSRCLTDVVTAVSGRVEEEFVPSQDLRSGEWIPETNENRDTRIDEHNVLNLDEVIRQDVLVNIPFRTLCQADCQGLCEICGTNLNLSACRCDRSVPTEPEEPIGRLGEALSKKLQRRAKGV